MKTKKTTIHRILEKHEAQLKRRFLEVYSDPLKREVILYRLAKVRSMKSQ